MKDATSLNAVPLPTFESTPFQKGRAEMLTSLLPRGSIGAELGVFKGEFSATIIKAIEPRELYLVDPWDREYGVNYPDWGDYTERGALTTERAMAESVSRTTSDRATKIRIVKDYSTKWLATLPDQFLNWIYIDSTHAYDDTVRELRLSTEKVKTDGIICGHDFAIGRNDMHHAVFRAVTEFTREGEFEIIWAGPWLQWAIRRSHIPRALEAPQKIPKGMGALRRFLGMAPAS
jgi:hypothetical protein